MIGPVDMNRPPFEGGHPGMRGPRGPEYPVDPWELGGMMGDPRPNIKSSFSIGKVYMTPNGPMRHIWAVFHPLCIWSRRICKSGFGDPQIFGTSRHGFQNAVSVFLDRALQIRLCCICLSGQSSSNPFFVQSSSNNVSEPRN